MNLRIGTTLRPHSGTRSSVRPSLRVPARVPVVAVVACTASALAACAEELRREGWQVHAFGSAAEIFGSGRDFDVVVVDCILPDGSGIDVVGYFTLSQPHARTIALTESVGRDAADAALRAGAFATVVTADVPALVDATYRAFQDSDRARELGRLARDYESQRRFADLGRLTAWVAHEVQAPVDSLAASLRMLEALTAFSRASIDEAEDVRSLASTLDAHMIDAEALLAECKVATARAGRLLRELQATVRAGDAEVLPLRISDVVDAAMNVVARGSAIVRVATSDDVVLARFDPLVHVVVSLVSLGIESVRHVTRGGVDVTSRREGTSIVIEVQDNGPGLTREQLGRLFEPLQNSRSTAGSHAGLALVAELVRRMGGAIEATSSLGIGTTFRVLVPIV